MSRYETKITIGNGGCGCLSSIIILIIFFFLIWAIFYGVPIGKHKWNINLFPPSIVDMNENQAP